MHNLTNRQSTIIRENQIEAPVNILAIAKAFEIKVYQGMADGNLSGKIVRDDARCGKSGYAIFVNSSHPLKRQRFTIAHEVAHFLLHKEKIGDGIVDDALYRSGLSNAEEVEANKLAADILMPWHLINLAMNDKVTEVPRLAEIFQVSESAISIRLGLPC